MRDLKPGQVMLWVLLFLAPWHFKIVSSLPRLFDVTRWWAPALFPETLVAVAAIIVSLVAVSGARRERRLPGALLLAASVTLCLVGLLLGSLFNERHTVYLVRVVVLQYALPALVFWLVWREIATIRHLSAAVTALVAGGGLLCLVATPVYFYSFSHFPPSTPIFWPASRILFNRGLLAMVHNDPRMLYDNLMFGNVLNISQLLVALLPMALALALAAPSRLARGVGVGAAVLVALHLDLCYSRGPLLVTIATLTLLGWLVYRYYRRASLVTAVVLTMWAVVTFGGPDAPQYWLMQLTLHEKSSARERMYFVLRPLGFRDTTGTIVAKTGPGGGVVNSWSGGRAPIGVSASPASDEVMPPMPGRGPSGEPVEVVADSYQVVGVRWQSYVRMALTGLGFGNYGILVGRRPGAGTHNMFLNILVNTGVTGLLGLIGLTVWAVRNFRRYLRTVTGAARSWVFGLLVAVAFGNVLVVGVLSLYEFEYLGTGTGATLFVFMLAASARLVTLRDGPVARTMARRRPSH